MRAFEPVVTGFLCVVMGAMAGCKGASESSGGGLDCAYLASDNCWDTTASAATACLPPISDTGTLSADGSSCQYAGGNLVSFANPLVLPVTNDTVWNFTVLTASGQTCLQYANDDAGFNLTVQGQEVTESGYGSGGIRITCPDGTSVQNDDPINLLQCGDGGTLGGLPGYVFSGTDTSVGFSLVLTNSATSNGVPVFNCQTASAQ